MSMVNDVATDVKAVIDALEIEGAEVAIDPNPNYEDDETALKVFIIPMGLRIALHEQGRGVNEYRIVTGIGMVKRFDSMDPDAYWNLDEIRQSLLDAFDGNTRLEGDSDAQVSDISNDPLVDWESLKSNVYKAALIVESVIVAKGNT